MVVLILVMCTLSIVFRRLGVYDRYEAMGLPRGSVRAVIALLLIRNTLFVLDVRLLLFLLNLAIPNVRSAAWPPTMRSGRGW